MKTTLIYPTFLYFKSWDSFSQCTHIGVHLVGVMREPPSKAPPQAGVLTLISMLILRGFGLVAVDVKINGVGLGIAVGNVELGHRVVLACDKILDRFLGLNWLKYRKPESVSDKLLVAVAGYCS